MILRHQTLGRILKAGIVAVIRAPSRLLALEMAQACVDGGIRALEVSLTTPQGLSAITEIREKFDHEVVVGVGTVLDSETARLAIDAGAQYVVTPAFNPETIRLCNRYQIPSLCGAMTPREIMDCLEAGVDVVKLFPGESMGPNYLKAIRAPFPHAPFMPTGGVDAANTSAWIDAGAVALGVGGSLTNPALRGDLLGVTERARALVAALSAARAHRKQG